MKSCNVSCACFSALLHRYSLLVTDTGGELIDMRNFVPFTDNQIKAFSNIAPSVSTARNVVFEDKVYGLYLKSTVPQSVRSDVSVYKFFSIFIRIVKV